MSSLYLESILSPKTRYKINSCLRILQLIYSHIFLMKYVFSRTRIHASVHKIYGDVINSDIKYQHQGFMKKWQNFLAVFLLLLALAALIAYLGGERNNAYLIEDCVKSCLPKNGVLEQKGFHVGPTWKSTASHNVVCTCK